MDSLKFNKIAAGLLCAGLLIMGLSKISYILVPSIEISQNSYPIKVENNEKITNQKIKADVIEPILAMLSEADINVGQKISKKCTACHSFELNGPNKVGPNLYNIVNKSIGKAEYNYSKAFLTLEGKWSYQELNKFLYKPKNYIKGTKMNYSGLSKTKDRANLIAWLRTLSENQVPLPTKEEITK